MSNKEQNSQEPKQLTEWQKRNIEFLKKKQSDDLQADQERRAQLSKRNPLSDDKMAVEEQQGEQESPTSEEQPKTRLRDIRITIRRNKSKEKKSVSRGRQTLAFLVVTVSMLAILFSLFLISPWSKDKVLKVTGVQNALANDIITASGIKDSDYITEVLFNESQIASRVKENNVWVQKSSLSYSFPNEFTIAIKEYPIVAYRQTANGYVSLLETGKTGGTVSSSNLPDRFITINLEKEEQVKSVIEQLNKLDSSIRDEIRIISLTPTKATSDLLTLEMYDGNTVRVPLSQIDKKMPYYNKLSSQQDGARIIDMEVGIYTTTSELESQGSEANKDSKQDSEASQNAQDTQNTDTTDSNELNESTPTDLSENSTETNPVSPGESQTALGQ